MNDNNNINVNDIYKDNKRNLTIIEKEYRENKNGDNILWYKYHCNKCGAELWMNKYNLLKDCGCACCNGKTVISGINDIATTNPEMVKYFSNINDVYTHTHNSSQKVKIKCTDCGYEKEMIIGKLYDRGFSCPKCGDGVSYPEKFMCNLLNNLNVKYIKEYSKLNSKWCDKYRYDFYFELNNEEYIIETHGIQHYETKNKTWDNANQVQENDKNKRELAIDNGIKPENYIVIDCRYSDFNFIKESILDSRLSELFDLSNINWIKIGQDAEKNLVKEICDYWHLHNEINNEGLTTTDLSKVFNVSNNLRRWLKQGTKLGWCNYNPKDERNKTLFKKGMINKNSKSIEIFKNGVSLGIYPSYNELERCSEKDFGVKLNNSKISMVINGKRNHHKGFTFKSLNK